MLCVSLKLDGFSVGSIFIKRHCQRRRRSRFWRRAANGGGERSDRNHVKCATVSLSLFGQLTQAQLAIARFYELCYVVARDYPFAWNGILIYKSPTCEKPVFITIDPYHVQGAVWRSFCSASVLAQRWPGKCRRASFAVFHSSQNLLLSHRICSWPR